MTPHADPRAVARSSRPTEGAARYGRDRAHRENLDRLRRLVMSRRSRLRRLIGMRAPEIVVRNEKRMLRAAVEAMLETGGTMDVGARDDAGVSIDRFDLAAVKQYRRSAPTDRRESERRSTSNGPLSETGR